MVQSMDQLKRRATDFPDIVAWVEVFATLVAVASKSDSQAVPELMAYLVKVIRAARVRGSSWQEYDKAYRRKAAAKKDRIWSRHDPDLWDRFILSPSQAVEPVSSYPASSGRRYFPYQRPQKRGGSTQSGSSTIATNAWKKTVCYSHNFDPVCARVANGLPCQFTHICYTCGQGNHKSSTCPNGKSSKQDW